MQDLSIDGLEQLDPRRPSGPDATWLRADDLPTLPVHGDRDATLTALARSTSAVRRATAAAWEGEA